jgi:hypothetical protein
MLLKCPAFGKILGKNGWVLGLGGGVRGHKGLLKAIRGVAGLGGGALEWLLT